VDPAASRPPGGGLLRAAPAQKERPPAGEDPRLLVPAQKERPRAADKTLLLVPATEQKGKPQGGPSGSCQVIVSADAVRQVAVR
jgi:hypothetical protein